MRRPARSKYGIRRSLSPKPCSQSSSVDESMTLWEEPNAAASVAISVRLGARGLHDPHPLFALARGVGGQLFRRARPRHQAETLHPRLEVGKPMQRVQLR